MEKYFVATVADLKEKDCQIVNVKEMELGIFFVDGKYYAYRNLCPHAQAPVCKGLISGTRMPSNVYEYEYGRDKEILRCPWHRWEFDLKTGEHLGKSNLKLRSYPVEVENDKVYVLLK